jgi:hypothetical protein
LADQKALHLLINQLDYQSKLELTINLLNELESETYEDTTKEWVSIALDRLNSNDIDYIDANIAIENLN